MVCRRSGVYLRQGHARLSDRITGMPLSYHMPFEMLLESVNGKSLNLWLNEWTDSYRFAIRYRMRLQLEEYPDSSDEVAPSAGLTAITGGVAPIYTRLHPGAASVVTLVMAKDRPTIQWPAGLLMTSRGRQQTCQPPKQSQT